jgi:hypothetical protein
MWWSILEWCVRVALSFWYAISDRKDPLDAQIRVDLHVAGMRRRRLARHSRKPLP